MLKANDVQEINLKSSVVIISLICDIKFIRTDRGEDDIEDVYNILESYALQVGVHVCVYLTHNYKQLNNFLPPPSLFFSLSDILNRLRISRVRYRSSESSSTNQRALFSLTWTVSETSCFDSACSWVWECSLPLLPGSSEWHLAWTSTPLWKRCVCVCAHVSTHTEHPQC